MAGSLVGGSASTGGKQFLIRQDFGRFEFNVLGLDVTFDFLLPADVRQQGGSLQESSVVRFPIGSNSRKMFREIFVAPVCL